MANEVDRGFWRDFRRVAHEENPESVMIGEIWESSETWLNGDMFDSTMNYDFRKNCRDFFALRKISAEEFHDRIVKMLLRYRTGTLRGPMPWEKVQDEEDDFFSRLIAIRKEHEELTYGDYTLRYMDHDGGYIYQRTWGDHKITVCLNNGSTTIDLREYLGKGSVLLSESYEAAKVIARKLGAKIFEIDLVKPLPKNTVRQMLVGGMQSTFGRRPKIKGVPDNIDYYDEIILGMPVWAGMPASPVNTFIKNYGVADKIDAVFTFSGGGDNDRCLAQLSKSLKNIKSQVALADRNSNAAKDNQEKLEKFVMSIK